MNLSVGIVGLPNAGKSTLFNALLKRQQARTGKHPFTTVEPNKGVVFVPDERLSQTASLAGIKKQTPATIEFIDIAGLVKGAHVGEGLGNQFLGYIREVNVILHVIRGFTDPTVPHVHEKIDPKEDLEIINTELNLSDLEILEKALESYKKDQKLIVFLKKLQEILNKEVPLEKLSFSQEEKNHLTAFPLLYFKPQIVILNIDEKDISKRVPQLNKKEVLAFCAKLEEDLAALAWIEKKEYLKAFKLPEPALEKVIKACFDKLNLIRFYTIAKGNEARAWAIPKGTTALSAAAKVHTDFAKKFIKAQVVPFTDFIKVGSWEKLKEQGKLKIEGRDYLIRDGDIVEFKIGN